MEVQEVILYFLQQSQNLAIGGPHPALAHSFLQPVHVYEHCKGRQHQLGEVLSLKS